jgi:hypothetical protein
MRRAHPELVTTFAMLGVQRASRTDIGDTRWFDRVPGLRGLAGLARRLRSRLAGAPAQMRQANFSFGAKTKQPSGLADE